MMQSGRNWPLIGADSSFIMRGRGKLGIIGRDEGLFVELVMGACVFLYF